MKKKFILSIMLFCGLFGSGFSQFWQTRGLPIEWGGALDEIGFRVFMPDANTVASSSVYKNNESGQIRIHRWNGTAWVQKGNPIDGISASYERAGRSISMPDSNHIAIGAPLNDAAGAQAGVVRIYRWNGTDWVMMGTEIPGASAGGKAGESVSMPDSMTIAIGSATHSSTGNDSGMVRIFRWHNNAWIQKGSSILSEGPDDHAGYVSMPDSNTIAVGAPSFSTLSPDTGYVRIFKWTGIAWVQKGNTLRGEQVGDFTGVAVSMPDSGTVAIGAYGNDGNGTDAGNVRVFSWNGTAWMQMGQDLEGESANDQSGFSISMPDAITLAVGAYKNEGGNYAGHVRVHQWNGINWNQVGPDLDGIAPGDFFGFSVSMPDAMTLSAGSPAHLYDITSGNLSHNGMVTVFDLSPANNFSSVQDAFSVYPNPSSGAFHLEFDNTIHALEVNVKNITGQTLHSSTLSGANHYSIDLNAPDGIYFLEVNADGIFGVRKIVLRKGN